MAGTNSVVLTIGLQILGAASCLYYIHKCFRFMSFYLLPPASMSRYKPRLRTTSNKPWGLITGSSAGIGFGVAQELAARGFNVVLLGHKPDELDEARRAIEAESPSAAVRIVVLDAEKASVAEMNTALADLADLNLTVVVNNVASIPVRNPDSDSVFQELHQYEPEVVDCTVHSSARFMLLICHNMLPVLISHAIRNKSRALIVNIGSAARFGLPLNVPYSAAKGFVHSASMALSREVRYRQRPVDLVAVLLAEVRTQGNPGAFGPGVPDQRQFAKALVDRAPRAAEWNMLEFVPWFYHAVMLSFLDLIPEWRFPEMVGRAAEAKIEELAAMRKQRAFS